MAIIMSFDAMLSAAEGDEVRVRFEIDDETGVFIDFVVGEDEDEITFAFDPADADKWARAFQQAAAMAAGAALLWRFGQSEVADEFGLPFGNPFDWDEMGP